MSKYAPVRISSSKDLGIVLTRARKSRGLSQREVAARLGVTQKWISSIEQGKSRAWIDKVLELSYFLGVQLYAKDANEIPTNPATNAPSIDDILSNES
jgi:transcriptional regulator with XRE-family HTH domain